MLPHDHIAFTILSHIPQIEELSETSFEDGALFKVLVWKAVRTQALSHLCQLGTKSRRKSVNEELGANWKAIQELDDVIG